MNSILECVDLTKAYSSRTVLKIPSLSLPKGKIIGLLGPNGSGKKTFIKMACGILTATTGSISIDGLPVGTESKKIVSYLPDNTYLSDYMSVRETINFFADFYEDFDVNKAYSMLQSLNITPEDKLKTLSKGTKEKVQLSLVMSRNAKIYFLDEPIGGVDPASRDYILNTIISNYNPDATIVISTHLIYDIESVLDDVIFIKNGQIMLASSVEDIKEKYQKSVDALFREVFRC